ncbi:hypothetical protein ACIBK8_16965 [Streptomyces sp. NPDC050161]|uniref:hypothetical protein n=1 Tax=Streptomyces sp. NPDC050161 TaxID=3365604 RepID=UPI0037B8AE0D
MSRPHPQGGRQRAPRDRRALPLLAQGDLQRAATDPAYATRLVDRLIATGRITPACDEQPHLTPEQEDAARAAVGGGSGGEEYVGASRCVLWPRHSRWHYAVVRYLAPHTLWIKWRYPVARLLILPDCDATDATGGCCTHFHRHPGPHNFPRAMT